mgnify:CR=1 FL=1
MSTVPHPYRPFSGRKRLSGRMAGIGLMLLGIFLFSANDALGKWLVDTYSVGAVLLFRSLAALVLLLPMIWRDRGFRELVHPPRPGLQLLRIVFATTEVAFFYASVRHLPLADVMTFYLAAPIFVAALSASVLKERIDARRWIAIFVGFVGVVIVLKPSTPSFSWPALIAMTGSFLFSLVMIITRQLRGTRDTTLVTYTTLAACLVGAALVPFGWLTPTLADFGLLSLLGVVAMLASLAVNRSLKLAPASVVVPYQYTMLLWAIVFGLIFFGDKPDAQVLIGAAIVMISGIYVLIREHRQAGSGETLAEEVGSTMNAQP